jgi:polysaccharide export outer membrane protein
LGLNEEHELMKTKWLITGLLVFLLVSFLSAIISQEEFVYEYKIGPNDLLQLTVIDFDDLNRQYQLLQEKNFIRNPQVSVLILEYMSKRIYLIGAVENTGPYELLGRMTLLKLLSQAGGLTPEAGDQIIIIRQLADGNKTSLRIPVDDLLLESDPSLDVPLQPDDIINVPVDKIVLIYVTGQVNNPGAIEFRSADNPTLLRAIAKAGGFNERAAKGKVLIKRTDENGEEIEIKVNVGEIMKGKTKDVKLQANDVVIVPEKWI